MPPQPRRDSPSPVQIGQSWPPYPPAEETELEKALRLEEEKEAKRVSDTIDLALEAERNELRKRKEYIKVLLLGEFDRSVICLSDHSHSVLLRSQVKQRVAKVLF